MRKGTESVQSLAAVLADTDTTNGRSNAERLASLAAMTMTRQTPGLVLPFVNTSRTSFTYTKGRTRRLPCPYTRRFGPRLPRPLEALQREYLPLRPGPISAWLSDIGADEMNNEVDVDLAVFDQLEGYRTATRQKVACTPCWIHRTDVALSL